MSLPKIHHFSIEFVFVNCSLKTQTILDKISWDTPLPFTMLTTVILLTAYIQSFCATLEGGAGVSCKLENWDSRITWQSVPTILSKIVWEFRVVRTTCSTQQKVSLCAGLIQPQSRGRGRFSVRGAGGLQEIIGIFWVHIEVLVIMVWGGKHWAGIYIIPEYRLVQEKAIFSSGVFGGHTVWTGTKLKEHSTEVGPTC